jgi:glycosyltransferase involved in cell wall biosynthesis
MRFMYWRLQKERMLWWLLSGVSALCFLVLFAWGSASVDAKKCEFRSEFLLRERLTQELGPYREVDFELIRALGQEHRGIVVYLPAVTFYPLQRPQFLMMELAKMGYICLFVDNNASAPLVRVRNTPRLFVVKHEETVARVVGFRRVVLLVTWALQMSFKKIFRSSFIWYDVLDHPSMFACFGEEYVREHHNIIRQAGVVTRTTENLRENLGPWNTTAPVLILPNACDNSLAHLSIKYLKRQEQRDPDRVKRLFSNSAVHKLAETSYLQLKHDADTANVQGHKKDREVVFIGVVSVETVDQSLLLFLAESLPDVTFRIYGNVACILEPKVVRQQNIKFHGPFEFEDKVSLLSSFGVALMLFPTVHDKDKLVSAAVSPLKMYEYACAGLQVVSPVLPSVPRNERWLHVAESFEEMVALVERALQSASEVETQQVLDSSSLYCLSNLWSTRIGTLLSSLNSLPSFWSTHANLNTLQDVALFSIQYFHFDGRDNYKGGAERYYNDLHELFSRLQRRLTTYQCGSWPWARRSNGMWVLSLARGEEPIDFAFSRLVFYRLIAGRGIVAIYSSFFEASSFVARPSLGISHGVSWDYPGDQSGFLNAHVLPSLKSLDYLVSVDTNTLNFIQTVSYDFSQERAEFVPNYADARYFHPPSDFRLRLQNGKRVQRICFPRRLYAPRGLGLVLKILPLMLKTFDNFEFHFIGRGEMEDTRKVTALVDHYPSRVFWRQVNPENMPQVYRDMDVTLVPTLWSEGTSLSLIEAMASGNLVIATRVGGLPDLVIDRFNGLLVDPRASSLAEALVVALSNHSEVSTMRENAVRASMSFTREVWGSKVEKSHRKFLVHCWISRMAATDDVKRPGFKALSRGASVCGYFCC